MSTLQKSGTSAVERALARFERRVREKAEDRSVAPVLIVAFGDSVTQGIGAIDQLFHEDVYHAQVLRGLRRAHPLTTFSLINAGVDGDTATAAIARLDRDVVRHDPDLVFVAFGLNDAALGGLAGVGAFAEAIGRLLTRARARQHASSVILLTPNMMLTRRNDAIADVHQPHVDALLHAQNDGLIAAYADAIRSVGERLDVPVVDVYAEWTSLASRGIDTTAMLSNGLNHPDEAGHRLAADAVLRRLLLHGLVRTVETER